MELPTSRPSPVETLQPFNTKTLETSERTFDESAMPTVAPPEPLNQPQQASKSEPPNRAEPPNQPEPPHISTQTSKPELANRPELANKPEPHTIEQQRKPELTNRPEQRNKSDGAPSKQSASHQAKPYTVAWNPIKRVVASLTDGEIVMFVANPQSGLAFLELLAELCPGGMLATD